MSIPWKTKYKLLLFSQDVKRARNHARTTTYNRTGITPSVVQRVSRGGQTSGGDRKQPVLLRKQNTSKETQKEELEAGNRWKIGTKTGHTKEN